MSEYDEYMAARQVDRSVLIGPSGVSGCIKQHAYKYLGVTPSDEVSTEAADIGTLLHLGWSAMIRAQYDPAERAPDVPIWTEGMPREGSADDVDFANRICTDLKTAKDTVWQMWANRGGPYQDYWDQLEVYALGLRQKYGGDWTLRIVALNRENGRRHEYERPADVERALALVERAGTRHEMLSTTLTLQADGADPLALAEMYPREGRGPGRGMPCDWCEFLSICWPSPSVEGGTPQSETVRGDAEAIGQYAQEYLEAQQEESKAKARKADAGAFLKGVDGEYPGPDGNTYTVRTIGERPSQVPDCESMKRRLEELGEQVPTKWTSRAAYQRIGRRK